MLSPAGRSYLGAWGVLVGGVVGAGGGPCVVGVGGSGLALGLMGSGVAAPAAGALGLGVPAEGEVVVEVDFFDFRFAFDFVGVLLSVVCCA